MKTISTLCLLLFFTIAQGQTVTTVTDGTFQDGIGITSNGDIYCSNFTGNEVFKYEFATGNVTTFATGFVNPNGIGVSPDDIIYICEKGGGVIHKYDTDGNVLATATGLNNPTGVKYRTLDNTLLWVSYNQNSINIMDPDTLETEILLQGPPINGPTGIAFIGDQTYISNFNDRKIFRLESDDTLTEIAQLSGDGAQNNFLGFLSSKGGSLYATQSGEHRIYRINPETGDVSLFAGSTQGSADGPIETATFNFPNGIQGDDANDRIYISDFPAGNLRIIENASLGFETIESAQSAIQLITNPENDTVTILGSLISASNYTVSIHDISGQLVQITEGAIENGNLQATVSTNTWSQGIYLVKIKIGETILARKFLKQ